MSKLRDKTREYKTEEDYYSHPRHAPYKRPHKDWHNLLLDGDEEFPEFEEDDDEV